MGGHDGGDITFDNIGLVPLWKRDLHRDSREVGASVRDPRGVYLS